MPQIGPFNDGPTFQPAQPGVPMPGNFSEDGIYRNGNYCDRSQSNGSYQMTSHQREAPQENATGPYLIIIEQPIERCRFRYKAEQGPHGSLRSATTKKCRSSPKVMVSSKQQAVS